MINRNYMNGRVMRIGGIVTMLFSAAIGMLILFTPSACIFVSSCLLVILGFAFIVGALTFFLDKAGMWKRR